MKILVLNWRDVKHPRAGGADVRLQQVYAPLVQQGHQVILYSCAFSGCLEKETVDGIEVHRLGNDLTFSFLCMLNLRKWVRLHQPDVVVEDFNKLPFYSPLGYKGPLIIQMHHLWRSSIFRETFFPLALFIWLSEEMIRFVYRRCTFSVVSRSTADELVAMGVPEGQIRVILNGADLERYRPSERPKEPFLLWIGRIQKYKGPLDACKVLEKLLPHFPDLKLVIVGDGPFACSVQSYVEEHGLQDHVELTGFISEEEKINLLQTALVHLQSSYKEGWGLSVIEANACGCPVVANNTTGLRDSVIDGQTGLLYPYCDLDCAADQVKRILTEPALQAALIDHGLKRASEFSWTRNSEEMLDYLQEVVVSG